MQAEIISIGDELLIGMTIDSNAAWIGRELTNLGIEVYQMTSISDNREHILKVVDEAMDRSDLVLVTGGLGPTSDDITKKTLSDYFNMKLVQDDQVLENIERFIRNRGLHMNENNIRQAEVPEGCSVLSNELGTAPGMWFEKEARVLVSMPGVPYEMKHIMTEHVIPGINVFFKRPFIKYRLVMTFGTFEAHLAEILEDFEREMPASVKLAYLPTSGIIKLRLTGRGEDEKETDRILYEQIDKLYEVIPDYIYGLDGISLEEATGKLLRENNLTMSIAESCTGGNISHMITSIPGSSDYFTGSVIAYDNRIKTEELGVNQHDLDKYGAVSEEVALHMARGIREKYRTDYGISTTGIAGPGGGTKEKPVGTVWIAVSSSQGSYTEKHNYAFTRTNNIRRASLAAINLLRKTVIKETNHEPSPE
ncbi:MAG: competence/damage-inducible protein A [Bacteroidales bacterium]|nr:competence/damage-inducible protein A [Bacteroidales bacterium]